MQMIYPQWCSCDLRLQASLDMITQQRLLLPGSGPSAVQMDCGIYVVLMSYLTIHCLPLSLLTPDSPFSSTPSCASGQPTFHAK